MVVHSNFQLKNWYLSLIPLVLFSLVICFLIAVFGSSSQRIERSVRVEASAAEVWSEISDPAQLLFHFPVGEDFWIPLKAQLTEMVRHSDRLIEVKVKAYLGYSLDFIVLPEQQEVWIISYNAAEPSRKDRYYQFRVLRIISVDDNYHRLLVSSYKPLHNWRQVIESIIYVESQTNLIYEDFLFHFKERLEQKRR